MAEYKLVSSTEKEHNISQSALELSDQLNNLKNKDNNDKRISLKNYNDNTLENLIKYLEHYKDNEYGDLPEVLISSDLKNQIEEWDYNFISKISYEETFHLINLAVELGLDHLHDLSCAKIAAFMKGKTPEEVNKEFTIECQLTQEEAKELGLDTN